VTVTDDFEGEAPVATLDSETAEANGKQLTSLRQ